MKRVICQSGLSGWQCHLRKNYGSLRNFKKYAETYGLLERLGFSSCEEAWKKNPIIEGSVNSEDFCVSK
jgi:hypothetical protein